jgi:mannose-6-phosphate isomerase-like protein (cupin superfamily)
MTSKVNLAEKLSQITDYWKPRILGELNGQELKLARLRGKFIWHHHENEDEALLCLSGRLRIEFRDDSVDLGAGELYIVPRGIEHRTSADEETHVLVFEPIGTRNTGNVEDPTFTAVDVPISICMGCAKANLTRTALWAPRKTTHPVGVNIVCPNRARHRYSYDPL